MIEKHFIIDILSNINIQLVIFLVNHLFCFFFFYISYFGYCYYIPYNITPFLALIAKTDPRLILTITQSEIYFFFFFFIVYLVVIFFLHGFITITITISDSNINRNRNRNRNSNSISNSNSNKVWMLIINFVISRILTNSSYGD